MNIFKNLNNNITYYFKNPKALFKILIITFIILYCLYILYFSSTTIYESLENIVDCSDCRMNPTSGNCKDIYDLSLIQDPIDNNKLDISLINTNMKFCSWEAVCPQTIDQVEGRVSDKVECCNDSPFYSAYTLQYDAVQNKFNNQQDCSNLENYIYQLNRDKNLTQLADQENVIRQARNMCYAIDNSDQGMLFKTTLKERRNIMLDPELSVSEILELQNRLSLRQPDQNKSLGRQHRQEINEYNIRLQNLNSTDPNFSATKQSIVNELQYYFFDISENIYDYELLNIDLTTVNATSTTDYILNKNEFFDCFGNTKKMETSFNQFDEQFITGDAKEKFDLSDNIDYFGTTGLTGDPSYTTITENNQRFYPDQQDLQMELRRLESIDNNQAPVSHSIINSYLTAINGFYERQIKNLMGPKTHTFNQELEFDNNSLETKEPTFFVYETQPNNDFSCVNSITGDNDFKYCGPAPYYDNNSF
jgi:hypothetical protein